MTLHDTTATLARPTDHNPAKDRRIIDAECIANAPNSSTIFCPKRPKNLILCSCPHLKSRINPQVETWPSGRRHTPAKGADGKPSRGFESLRLRHYYKKNLLLSIDCFIEKILAPTFAPTNHDLLTIFMSLARATALLLKRVKPQLNYK